jgi:hypothetical protein
MSEQDFISSSILGHVILKLISQYPLFKDEFKNNAPSIAADIESAATNPNCSCRGKVLTYIKENNNTVGAFLYSYTIINNVLPEVEMIFEETSSLLATRTQPATGRVAKTTIKNWPDFAKGLNEAGFTFNHMSTSIVGDDVYVFFL